MIFITPAILVNKPSDLKNFIHSFSIYFNRIDIDFMDGSITSSTTVSLDEILNIVANYLSHISFGFHLMTNNVDLIKDFILKLSLVYTKELNVKVQNFAIYLHQEVLTNNQNDNLLEFILSNLTKESRGVVVSIEQDIIDLDFYNNFSEVQIMTVQIGAQGGKFEKAALNKIYLLKDYNGVISIDGGVNLETSQIIKQYRINRVSVGSYFQRSTNLLHDLEALDKILNA